MGLISAGQVDRMGNMNRTVFGDYVRLSARLPGAAGATKIGAACREFLVPLGGSLRSHLRGFAAAKDASR